jgi:hypothetical protein
MICARFLQKVKDIFRRPDREMEVPKVELRYIDGIEYSESLAKLNPNNCAVIERTADGICVGPCCFHMKDGKTCPRHGIVKTEIAK